MTKDVGFVLGISHYTKKPVRFAIILKKQGAKLWTEEKKTTSGGGGLTHYEKTKRERGGFEQKKTFTHFKEITRSEGKGKVEVRRGDQRHSLYGEKG